MGTGWPFLDWTQAMGLSQSIPIPSSAHQKSIVTGIFRCWRYMLLAWWQQHTRLKCTCNVKSGEMTERGGNQSLRRGSHTSSTQKTTSSCLVWNQTPSCFPKSTLSHGASAFVHWLKLLKGRRCMLTPGAKGLIVCPGTMRRAHAKMSVCDELVWEQLAHLIQAASQWIWQTGIEKFSMTGWSQFDKRDLVIYSGNIKDIDSREYKTQKTETGGRWRENQESAVGEMACRVGIPLNFKQWIEDLFNPD